MGSRLRFSGGLLVVSLSIFQFAGCCCDDSNGSPEKCGPHGRYCGGVELACFGYHSTCWQPWPEECPTCPAPTWSAPVTNLTPAVTPEVPSEPVPKPESPETPPPPQEEPKAQPEESPKSEPPKVEPPKAEPAKPEEPALQPIKQVSNKPDRTTPARAQLPLAVQRPTVPAKIVNVRPPHHLAERSEASSGTPANIPSALQNALPRPISSWLPPPVVVEVDPNEELSIRTDRIQRNEGLNPTARPFVNGSLQSQRFQLP